MEKITIGTNVFIYPMPVVLVGVNIKNRANFMTVGWISRVNAVPPMLAVGINKAHYTPEGILENQTFSVNVPSADMIEKTDYCGLVSGRNMDKSKLFDVFYGTTKTAPMIKECPLCLECTLNGIYELPTNNLYIGEIVTACCDDKYLTHGKLDIQKINPLMLTMPDNNYWTIGKNVGKAWNVGRILIKDPQ